MLDHKTPGSTAETSAPADTLEHRVRQLERIIASTPRLPVSGEEGRESADAGAVQRLTALTLRLRRITEHIHKRVGLTTCDAGDLIAARLLLDDLTAALGSCRVIAEMASSRLQEPARAIKDTHRFLNNGSAWMTKVKRGLSR